MQANLPSRKVAMRFLPEYAYFLARFFFKMRENAQAR